jgi:hypothetical protein
MSFMLSMTIKIIILSVIMLNVIVSIVVAPKYEFKYLLKNIKL